MKPTFYDTLEVKRSATADEIKIAFRRLANIHHPDKPTGNADRFKKISEAYSTLSNPQKRRSYDFTLPFVPPPAPASVPHYRTAQANPFGFRDDFADVINKAMNSIYEDLARTQAHIHQQQAQHVHFYPNYASYMRAQAHNPTYTRAAAGPQPHEIYYDTNTHTFRTRPKRV